MEDEALGGGALMDELLRDFSGDSPPPPPPPAEAPPRRRSHGSPSSAAGTGTTIVHPSLLDGPVSGSALQTFPAFVEEDLEWLSNKDAFPSLDTFLSVPHRPSPPAPAGAKRPSPVSVLDGAPPPPPPSALALQWAAGRERSRGHQRRRRDLRALRGKSPEQAAHASREKRRCWHCATEETPQWRAGPEGPKTLCNACGVRYKSGRLVPEYRPASSPTFSSELHSNSHRRIMEMRRRNLEELGTAAKQG